MTGVGTCGHPTAPFARPGVYIRVLYRAVIGFEGGTGTGAGSETGTGARVGTGTQTVTGMGTEREHERVVEANEVPGAYVRTVHVERVCPLCRVRLEVFVISIIDPPFRRINERLA